MVNHHFFTSIWDIYFSNHIKQIQGTNKKTGIFLSSRCFFCLNTSRRWHLVSSQDIPDVKSWYWYHSDTLQPMFLSFFLNDWIPNSWLSNSFILSQNCWDILRDATHDQVVWQCHSRKQSRRCRYSTIPIGNPDDFPLYRVMSADKTMLTQKQKNHFFLKFDLDWFWFILINSDVLFQHKTEMQKYRARREKVKAMVESPQSSSHLTVCVLRIPMNLSSSWDIPIISE